jgi:fatty-acid desaturase
MRRYEGDAAQWSNLAEACAMVARGRTARTALPVALVVGTVLSLVNEGDAVFQGRFTVSVVVRVITNYVVPYCVASFGYLAASRRPGERRRTGMK